MDRQTLAPLREAEWVVYAKRPFSGPKQVLDYVGRYTHRVAISNIRLLDIAEDKVTFRYKDYRHDAQQKTMTVEAEEFIRRFLFHVLPEGFRRIRYYGFLANRYREEKLARCRELLDMPAPEPPALEGAKDYPVLMFSFFLAMNSGVTLWLAIYESTAIDSGRVSWKARGSVPLPMGGLTV